jgi:hypothetical protein
VTRPTRTAATALGTLGVLLGLLVVPQTAASAATVVSGTGLPSPMFAGDLTCAGGTGGSGARAHVNGPGTPPRGSGSLRVTTGAEGTAAGVSYPFSGIPAASLTTMRFSFLTPVTAGATVTMQLNIDPDGTGKNDRLVLQPELTNTWETGNLLTESLNYFPSAGGNAPPRTYASYLADNPDAVLRYGTFFASNCSGDPINRTAYLDDWRIGINGVTTIYDFEAPGVTITFPAPTARIVAGQGVRLRAAVSTEGTSLAGRGVQLWAKPKGKSYSKVGTFTLSDTSRTSTTQHPLVTTTYQWRRPGDSGHAPASSVQRTVKVATKLTLKVADTTLSAAQKLKARGATTPVGKGLTVKLWKKRSGADLLVAKTTTASDGTWHVSKDLAKGKYDLYATVAATSRNVAGKSRSITVTAA